MGVLSATYKINGFKLERTLRTKPWWWSRHHPHGFRGLGFRVVHVEWRLNIGLRVEGFGFRVGQ